MSASAVAAGLALALRESRRSFLFVVVLAALALIADLELVRRTLDEGPSFASDAFERAPGFMSLWACLWMSWQVALIWRMLRHSGARDARAGAVS